MTAKLQHLRNRLAAASQKPAEDDPGVLRQKQADVLEAIMEAFEADRAAEPDCGCEHKGAARAAHAAHTVVERMMNEADAAMIADGGHSHEHVPSDTEDAFPRTPYSITISPGFAHALDFLGGRYEGASNVKRTLWKALTRIDAEVIDQPVNVPLSENEAWNINEEVRTEMDGQGEGWLNQLEDPSPLIDLWNEVI